MTARVPRAPSRPVRKTEPEAEAAQGPFRIRVVAQLTGVPEPTLRAWERRYGIPTPERTASGYRLYGAEQVKQVQEMRRLCAEGMAAAEAARLLRGQPRGPTSADDVRTTFGSAPTEGKDPYAVALQGILAAVERFDDDSLDAEMRRLMFLGSAAAILEHVLTPALREIGRRYHDGRLSIAQEHLASQRLGTLLRDLLRLSPGADSEFRVVLACFADEDHELGLLGIAAHFSAWGLKPVFLGARTPPDAIRTAVAAVSPVLVALSVTVAPRLARARELVEGYAAACAGVPWVVGGGGVGPMADLVREHGGTVAPGDTAEMRSMVEKVLSRASSRRAPARS